MKKLGIPALSLVGLGLLACAGQDSPRIEPESSLRTGNARVGDRTVAWVESGLEPGPSVPTIVFVHGSPGSWTAWRRFVSDPQLQDRARLVAVDRLGFGGSGRGIPEPSLLLQAEAVAAAAVKSSAEGTRDGRSRRPVLWVGHSYGGPVICRLAVDRPDLVDALLLIAASVDPALEKLRWYNRLAAHIPWLIPKDLETSNLEILPLKDELEKLATRLSEIRAPAVVIQGLKDRLVPADNADFLQRSLSRVEVRKLPDAGHLIPWRRPEVVDRALRQWLDEVGVDGEAQR